MRKGLFALALLLLVSITPISAQANQSPLLEMLARIPDTSDAHEYLTYVDYQALYAARPGAPTVHSWQDFDNLSASDSALFMSAFAGISGGPEFFNTSFGQADQMPQVVGFDLFAIERGAEYGQPPNAVTLLEGSFDASAIIAAQEQRGYTQTSSNGLTLLCPAKGCDSGATIDPVNANRANPFGGDLGRSQPVIVGDHFVASSASIDALNQSVSAIAGTTPSLADNPDYRAAAEAITASGTLLQVNFFPAASISPASSGALAASLGASPTQIAQIPNMMSTEQAKFVPLPQYTLVALADTATSDEEQAQIALVYGSPSDAQAAAALFPVRLEKYVSLKTNTAFGAQLTASGLTSIDVSVYSASTNRSVLVLTLHAPLPSSTIPTDGSRPQAMGQVYRLLLESFYNRDVGWLATSF